MPNHFHFLVRIKDEKNIKCSNYFNKKKSEKYDISAYLSKQYSNLFSSYTQAYNIKYHRRGSLFLKNFCKINITSNEYIQQCLTYIHLNPVYHNFVLLPNEWIYSSYNLYLLHEKSIVAIDEGISFFEDLKNFKYFHNLKRYEKYMLDMDLNY